MPQKGKPFRVGRVRAHLRGRVWYLCYWENGKRRRPRVGNDRGAAKRLAAEVNSQLEAGAPSVLSFEKVSIPELRRRWLDHHENVRRSARKVCLYSSARRPIPRFEPVGRRVRAALGRRNGRQRRELAGNWCRDSILDMRRSAVGFHMGNIG